MTPEEITSLINVLSDASTIGVLIWCLYQERKRVDFLMSAVAEERRRLWAYILVLRGGEEKLTDKDAAGLAEIMTRPTHMPE